MIVSIYAILLVCLFIFLSFRTLKLRRKLKIAIGDGGNQELVRAMRVHANFAEYVPISLVMATLVELSGAHYIFVHIICLCLLLGRFIHAYGVSNSSENFKFRVQGMVLTFSSLGISCIVLLAMQVISF